MSVRDACAAAFLTVTRADRSILTWWRNRISARSARRESTAAASPFSVLVVCVYRTRNAARVRALLSQCPANAQVRLWALDEGREFPDLTVGSGPGGKFELVNRLLGSSPVPEESWVVVADDDVLFSRGDVGRLLRECSSARLDLAQPSHSMASYRNHPFTLWRPWSRVRFTGFVENGPLFAVSPRAARSLVPFTEGGMGWGIEIEWNRRRAEGVELGIVDTCRILHLDKTAGAYSSVDALERQFATYGVDSVDDIKTCERTWYLCRRRPPKGEAVPAGGCYRRIA